MSTDSSERTPHLARIAVHPIKSLEPVERERARIVANGGLERDREYAMVDEDGVYVNGKRTADIHRIRASFDDDLGTVALRTADDPGGATARFDLEADRAAVGEWLTDYFGYPVELERDADGGFPDDADLSGPTVVSTATIREVASWFEGVDERGIRLRLRANLEVGGVEPFWEDRLFAGPDRVVAFRVGDAVLRGANPCQRCVVPTRDPHTGEAYPGFRETFVENRERTLPEWADRTRFDHYYRVTVNTKVPRSEWGTTLSVGDEVTVLGERPVDG